MSISIVQTHVYESIQDEAYSVAFSNLFVYESSQMYQNLMQVVLMLLSYLR